MANFKCKSCKKIHSVSSYRLSIKNDEKVYVDPKTKEALRCECSKKTILEYVEGKFNGFCTTFGKFSSMTPDQKQEVLKKRSKEHFKKEINEQKYEKNKQLIKKFRS